jgi:hypothetical protein
MVGAGQPEDARCPCTTKFAELTDDALVWFCDGHMGPLALPYTVLAGGKEAIKAHLASLPPRRKRFGSKRKKRPKR